MRIISDAAITNQRADKLDFQSHATRIADYISCLDSPATLAIYGDFGSGKSSLLHLITNSLNERPLIDGKSFTALIFPASRFAREQSAEAIVEGIYHSVQGRTRSAQARRDIQKYAVAVVDALFRVACNLPLKVGGSSIGLGGGTMTQIHQDMTQYEKEHHQAISGLRIAQDDLNRLCHASKHVLVICVDDIDRCEPPQIGLEVLEAIKLVTELPNTIFLFALDREILGQTVATRYKSLGLDAGSESVQRYLDKWIEFSLPMPPINLAQLHEMSKFVTDMRSGGITTDEHWYLLGLSPPNPRRAKRLGKSLLYYRMVMGGRGEDSSDELHVPSSGTQSSTNIERLVFIKMMVIRDCFPQLRMLMDTRLDGLLDVEELVPNEGSSPQVAGYREWAIQEQSRKLTLDPSKAEHIRQLMGQPEEWQPSIDLLRVLSAYPWFGTVGAEVVRDVHSRFGRRSGT